MTDDDERPADADDGVSPDEPADDEYGQDDTSDLVTQDDEDDEQPPGEPATVPVA